MPEPSDDPLEETERASSDPGVPESLTESLVEQSGGPATEPDVGDLTVGVDPERTEATGRASFELEGISADTELTTGFADGPRAAEASADPATGIAIKYLGDYQLIGVLGKGGMGVVYRARQVSLNRIVALKLIRAEGLPSESEQRRFQHEAEAVASLDHPGIVPIYEVGMHEGRHYFSMKLIPGKSLQKASPGLKGDFPAIARILAGSARATQHAHERGILHRDIKPANILLDAVGAPHLTDFGLAKRIDTGEGDLTQTDAVVGTPAYMAPEQATATRGAVTIATDIYGLGSVLYALLTGHAPHRGSTVLEVLDAVRDACLPSPLKDDPTIPRDLETICMKCLEKDPRRRYHSAGDLADDLDRWLDGRPITARKVGPATRAVMWCKRKPVIAGLAAALVISACVGATGILINWREVRRQRDELARANVQIRSEWEGSRTLNEFLVSDLLAWSSPFVASRRDVPVSALLDRSANLAATRFAKQPKIEASIRQILGNAYLALGMLPKAEVELLNCARLRQSLSDQDDLDRFSTDYVLARLRLDQGNLDEAETLATRAYNGRKKLLGDADAATLEVAELLGALLKMKGKIADAKAHFEKLAVTARQAFGDEHALTLHMITDLAVIAHDQGQFQEAAASFDTITQTCTRLYGADHPETIFARSRLGATLYNLDNAVHAEGVLKEVLEPAREILGADHPETLRISNNLAAVLSKLGKNTEAAKVIEETIKRQGKSLPADHADSFAAEINRAVILLMQDKATEAEPIIRELVPRIRPRLREDDPLLANVLAIHAGALMDLNRPLEAEPINAEALIILRKTMPPDHLRVLNAEGTHAALLLANGKFSDAEKYARKVLADRSKPGGVDSPWRLGIIKSTLGASLAGQKNYVDAEPLLLEGYETVRADAKAPKRRLSDALERVIRFYEATEKPEKAAEWRARREPKPDL